jgi:FAD/FMN-containing dehydrogenase
MSPLYQGETCMPQSGNTSTCELGGFPSYSVKATTVSQIQLAVNFARNLNLRLVVHNTGHDFLGKSTGAGALSIWTHNLKSISFIKSYSSPSYKGPAFKLGAGIQVLDLYEAAKKYGVTAVGGECKGVGVTGGYIAGGGHSPISSKYGMGADQVLSIDVVTPDGRFVTADEKNNKDLFWAIRGGGGGTFGVVTSMTVKVHPKMNFSGVTFTILSGPGTNVPDDIFWAALEAYWRKFPGYAAKGTYGYSSIFPLGPAGGYMWSMLPWLVPQMSLVDFKAMVTPLFDEWTALGLQFEPVFFEHDNFYDTWTSHFPVEGVANSNLRTASRLFPIKNWADEVTLNKTISTIRSVIEDGSAFIQYNINGAAPAGTPDNAVNPAWRDATLYGIFGGGWAPDAPLEDIAFANKRITNDWGARFRAITPGSGGYLNEGDVMEPNFGQAFFGSNYDRLKRIKKATDPWNVFWAPTAVGSEDWYITGQEDWLTLQTGRLCPK